MKIAHCTDLHINPEEGLVRNIDVRSNAEITLKTIKQHNPDLLILGGDLAATCGEIEAYHWIKKKLEGLSFRSIITAGNHDSYINLRQVFDLSSESEDELYFHISEAECSIICMDSSKTLISQQQLKWFREITASLESDTLLFLHHPPVDCECLFMDRKYPLQNRDELFDIIKNCDQISNIFCGHYHTEKTVVKSGKNVFITPSTMMQMSPFNNEYELLGSSPGWRLIDWQPGNLKTSVHYIKVK